MPANKQNGFTSIQTFKDSFAQICLGFFSNGSLTGYGISDGHKCLMKEAGDCSMDISISKQFMRFCPSPPSFS